MSNRTDIVVETDNAEGQVLLSASRVYDLTEDKTQDTINGEIRNTLTQLDGAKAAKVDLTNISQTSPTCTVTNGITKGTYFYLDGVLTRAIEAISENAQFTSSNCETVTAGGLNKIAADIIPTVNTMTFHSLNLSWKDSRLYTCPVSGYYVLGIRGDGAGSVTARWGIGGDSWLFASQNNGGLLYIPLYLKAGTVLWTRDVSSSTTSEYQVLGYWS